MSDRRFIKSKGVVTRNIAGEVILVPVTGELADMQKIFSLDAVAQFIWDGLDNRHSEHELAEQVHGAFRVGLDEAHADLREFMDSLVDAGLVIQVI